jgi:hypothetical protein
MLIVIGWEEWENAHSEPTVMTDGRLTFRN